MGYITRMLIKRVLITRVYCSRHLKIQLRLARFPCKRIEMCIFVPVTIPYQREGEKRILTHERLLLKGTYQVDILGPTKQANSSLVFALLLVLCHTSVP